MLNFCHLHVHSHFSLLDGVSKPEEIAHKVKNLGQDYVALTDHGNIDGVISFQKACLSEGITPIIGCEGYIIDDLTSKEKPGHITFLVKNNTGWKNLCSLLTFANLHGFYRKPRMTYSEVLKHSEGLVIMTACSFSFLTKKGGIDFFKEVSKKTDTFLEVMPHNLPEQKSLNKTILDLHKETGIPLVATYDSHYINKDDHVAQEVLLAIQRKTTWNDPQRWKFNLDDLFLCDSGYIFNKFKDIDFPVLKAKQAIKNTIKVAELCKDFRIQDKNISLPSPKTYPDLSNNANLKKLCFQGYKDIFHDDIKNNKIYYDRFIKEFKVIRKLNLSDYFLIVFDLLNWCREQNIALSTGRGSSSGSIITYLLKITTIDPIRYNLIFERFLNIDRGDMADIDIDVPDIKREQIRQYLIQKYGKDNISGVSTFMKMKAKGVLRDVSRVFEVPLKEVGIAAKAISNGDTISDFLKTDEGRIFSNKYKQVTDICKILEGTIRGASQHASAIIVSKEDLTQSGQCYLAKRKGTIVVNWAKGDAERQGLLKLDLLGLNQITIIKETQDLIKESGNVISDLNYLNPNEKEIFEMLSKGDTAGVFQMNTPHITKFVKRMGIENFSHMIDVIALVRPGPLESGMADEYIERKHGKEWNKEHEIYEDITKDSFGQAIFQEDLMFVITRMAGLPFTIADKIRKIIGKKRDVSEMLPYKKMFIDGCIKQDTFSKIEAEDFWHVMENASKYLFNRSHSVAYAHIGYQCAWLKYHYPLEFLCANMTYGKEDKKSDLIKWGFSKGIKIKLPKIGISKSDKWIIRDGVLYAPFTEVKGIGEKDAKKSANLAKKRQLSFFDLTKENDTKLEGMLESIGAYTDDIPKTAQSYFSFPVSDDMKITHPELFNFIGETKELSHQDLLEGKYIPAKAIKKLTPVQKRKLKEIQKEECNMCPLGKQANAPVKTTIGKYNIMIIGEAPGYKENLQGKPFIGKTGQLLWEEIKGFKRGDFCLTNVCKCYPSETKTPSKVEIETCFEFLKKEIEIIEPKIILAFGNVNLMAFLGQKNGIMKENGKTIWIEEHKAWVTFCLHPISAFYHEENMDMLREGLNQFTNLIKGVKGDKSKTHETH